MSEQKQKQESSGDFGVRPGDTINANYASGNTKRADPGGSPPRAGEDGDDSARTAGAGGVDSGVGSSSGGDIDTDIIGFGSAEKANPDEPGTAGRSNPARPARGTMVVKGSTVQVADDATTNTQSDSATPARSSDELSP